MFYSSLITLENTYTGASEDDDLVAGVEQVYDIVERVDVTQARATRRLTQHAHDYLLEKRQKC